MESLSVFQEGISAGSAAAVQSQPETVACKPIDCKLKKILDKDCLNTMPSQDQNESTVLTERESVADHFRDRIDLKCEHSVNGVANGVSETLSLSEMTSSPEEEILISDCSSRCDCLSGKLSVCSVSSNKPENSSDTTNVLYGSSSPAKKEHDDEERKEIVYVSYESELQMPDIMRLIQKDLSEPYSIYTYRYFIHNWPKLCFLAMTGAECVGAIVCKLDLHRKAAKRGYIAMLAVDENHRNKGIGSNLVLKAIGAMVADNADEVVLETEITNQPALRLYENLGFVRDKRLFRYYLNGVDALRLKLWLR